MLGYLRPLRGTRLRIGSGRGRRAVMIAHLHDREKALELFGWKGREAEWIALVCLHSGVFTRSQFCFYFEGARRNRASRFVRDLVDRELAVEDALPNKAVEQRRAEYPTKRFTGC